MGCGSGVLSRKKTQLPRPFLRAAGAQWRAGSGEQAGVFLSFSYLNCTGVLVFCCVCVCVCVCVCLKNQGFKYA